MCSYKMVELQIKYRHFNYIENLRSEHYSLKLTECLWLIALLLPEAFFNFRSSHSILLHVVG